MMTHERPPYLDEPRWPTDGLPPPEPVARPSGSRRATRKLIVGGVAAACALGLGLGLLAKPSFRDNADGKTSASPAASAGQIQIVKRPVIAGSGLRPPANQPVATDDAQPADTISHEAVSAVATPAYPRPAPRPTPVALPEPVPEPVAPPVRQIQTSAPAPARLRPQPAVARVREDEQEADARPARPSFNCRFARSQSERLICGDGRLAAYDRQLNRAFNQAVRSGVSYTALRREQDRWLRARENAARVDPEAVEGVYRSRIAELEEMADGG